VPRTLLKIFVEHLFPTRRVEAGGVRYHAVEVKKDGVVVVAADALAIRLPHGSLSFNSTSLMSFTA
jgi:hypothetical protein